MTKKLILAILLLFNHVCFAQERINNSTKATALGSDDSVRITELFFAGLKEKIAQNFQKSDVYYKQILAIDPANHATMFELANSYHAQKMEQEAERVIRNAITVKPRNEWYWALLADIYIKTNNFSRLPEVYDDLIRISPDKEDYYFDKADALHQLNKLNEALAVYDEIEKKHGPSDNLFNARQRIYQKQNKTDIIALGLEELIKGNPQNISNYVQLGRLYYTAGYKDKALQTLRIAKNTDPGNAAVRIDLANLYRLEGKPEEAFAELKSAFESSEMDVESKRSILLSLFSQFENAEVREQATDLAAILVKIYPDDIKIRTIYGDMLLHDKKPEQARQSYRNAIKLNNRDYPVWENLIRVEIDESDFAAAVKDAEDALVIFPANAALYLYAGIAYSRKGDYEKAISNFRNAESRETEDKQLLSQIYTGLADSYLGLKHYKASNQAYEKALELNPHNTDALNKYATSLSVRGNEDLTRAKQIAHLANELEPDNPIFKKTYDRISLLYGKYKNAIDWIDAAMGGLELSSQDYLIWENIIRIGYETSDFNAVIENGEKTITIFTNEAAPYLYMGLTYIQKKDYEKAASYLQKAANLQKENKDLQTLIYSGFGDLYKALNKHKESDQAYEKALQIDPYNLYALNSYAYSLSLRGENLDKAERMVRQTNELEPNNAYFEDIYALVLFRQKKYKDARIWIEKAIKNDITNNAERFERYGDILIHLGETDLAVEQWKKAKNNGLQSEKLGRKINGKKYIE